MTRLTATTLLFLYLMATTELHQVMRVPILVQHFIEHQSGNPNLSLTDFMALHYLSGDVRNPDYARDQQLPFKNNNCPEATLAVAMPPDDLPDPSVKAIYVSRKKPLLKSLFTTSSVQFSIWQPPRV